MKTIFKSLLVISFLLLHFNSKAITIQVKIPGTLPTLIEESQKYEITELILIGNLNGTDIGYIREMAGRGISENATTAGKLDILNLADAHIVRGGNSYFGWGDGSSGYYTSNNQIGPYMFMDCISLTSVAIPNSVTLIDGLAFGACIGLTSITIPASVTSLRPQSFEYCINLNSFIVEEQNNNYSTIDGVLCNKEKTTLIAYPNAKASNYIIPNSIKSIGFEAFRDCINLTSVSIPNSVVSIGKFAFYDCSGLSSVSLGNGITSIEDSNFGKCTNLTSIVIPNGVQEIGLDAFYDCSNLMSLIIPNSVTRIQQQAFYGCEGLKEIHTKNSIPPIIADHTFSFNKTNCNLYVPQGTSNAYSIWYFNNIIEEESNEILHTVSLSSNVGGKLLLNEEEVFSKEINEEQIVIFTIIPDAGYKINTVLFNEIDVTTQLTDNTFITPINQTSHFDVVFKKSATAINPINDDNVSIHCVSNGIAIETKEAILISIFTVSGQKAYHLTINGSAEINLNKGIYIVKVNDKSQKVIVR